MKRSKEDYKNQQSTIYYIITIKFYFYFAPTNNCYLLTQKGVLQVLEVRIKYITNKQCKNYVYNIP